MISDTLSDAVVQIKSYLDDSSMYESWATGEFLSDQDKLACQRVYEALEAMEIARISLDSII